ncbi:glycoside hydrolase family 73 protein, partial [Enterococcus faecium]|nr:glycoside hydrolase family 73 protein [Enterococcus faecium]
SLTIIFFVCNQYIFGLNNYVFSDEISINQPEIDENKLNSSLSMYYNQNSFLTDTQKQNFINSISGYAQKLANQNDLYASVMMAQAILESGWGMSELAMSPNYNLFGIKGSYNGQYVIFPTQEYVNGHWITVNAKFRKYPSYKESLQDNANVIKNTSFQPGVYYYWGVWKSHTRSYRDATNYLTGRYATAPNYGQVLNEIIETYGLTKYDTDSSKIQTSQMYRLYNPHSGEHLYTLNQSEKNSLPKYGWKYEGVSWLAPNQGTAVYRLYNPYSGDHLYTSNWGEINNLTRIGWRYEGISFYSGGPKNILRLFNPYEKIGTHHFTLSTEEKNYLVTLGWRYEGKCFSGY